MPEERHPEDGSSRRLRALQEARGIVFVCSGNMVRSAFAHLYAEHLRLPRRIRSVATTYRNDRLFPETASALLARGIHAARVRDFRPHHLDDVPEEELEGFLALGMTHAQLASCRRRPELREASHLLGTLVGAGEIADPVLEGADFEATFALVAACVERLAERLESGGA